MDSGWIYLLLRMAIFAWGLLILVQLPCMLASEPVNWSKVCEGNRVAYLNSSNQLLFYINRVTVNKVSFCKAFKLYHASGCFGDSSLQDWEEVENLCRGSELSLAKLSQKAGRKVLGVSGTNVFMQNLSKQSPKGKDNRDRGSLLTPKTMAMAVPGMFLLCCALLCPCFQSKRKEIDHAALAKEACSMESISSLEANSPTQKVPASPFRVPQNPHRAPPSPHRDRVPPSPHRDRVPPSPSRFSISPKMSGIGSIHLSMSQVLKATQSFSPSLQVGEGGFGTVYRAQLQDGQVVAIKRAKKELFDTLQGEFSSEVELLTKIEHRNLVKLLGYLEKGNERILITEYIPNGTLRDHLDGQRDKILDFNQRLEIAIDIAHGLTYLHLYAEKQIIHRDVKSSNILLTDSCHAKVADFGFARLGPPEGGEQTHVVTKVKGTVGYLDPEYLKTYQLTPKSDVYSFGILLVEILTSRRPVEMKRAADERITVRWAFKKYTEGKLFEILDPLMNEVIDADILSKIFGLAFQCAAPTRLDRPNMKEVGEQLWAIRMAYFRSVKRGG